MSQITNRVAHRCDCCLDDVLWQAGGWYYLNKEGFLEKWVKCGLCNLYLARDSFENHFDTCIGVKISTSRPSTPRSSTPETVYPETV